MEVPASISVQLPVTSCPPVQPLYDLDDVDGLLKLLRPCEYGSMVQINNAVTVRFTDVGHLLGSAAIEAWLHEGKCEKKMVFSGDIGNLDQPILCDPKHIADRAAEKCNIKGIMLSGLLYPALFKIIIFWIPMTLIMYLGSDIITTLMGALPPF